MLRWGVEKGSKLNGYKEISRKSKGQRTEIWRNCSSKDPGEELSSELPEELEGKGLKRTSS